MSDQPRTRQELYDRIRQSSREEVILEEMIRLGFWRPQGKCRKIQLMKSVVEGKYRGNLATSTSKTASSTTNRHSRSSYISNDWRSRGASVRRLKNVRERERQERAEAWRQRKQEEIVYLGDRVSGGLNYTECNQERLQSYGLPIYNTGEQIASAMGINIGQLRFLAFSRKTSPISHYISLQNSEEDGRRSHYLSPNATTKTSATLDT